MIPYALRPSLGFVVLLAAVGASLAFFGFGLARPPLEEVWRLDAELGAGLRERLTEEERAALARSLAAHPSLVDALTEHEPAGIISVHDDGELTTDWAYLVDGGAAGRLRIRYRGTAAKGRVKVKAWVGGETHQGEVAPEEDLILPLGSSGPRLVELHLESYKADKRLGARHHPVYVERLSP